MPRLLLVNINPRATTLDGCNAIAAVLREVGPVPVDVDILHYSQLAGTKPAASTRRYRGVILGPNGTPFPAYPAAFDDFLGWVRRRRKPLLGICGGHQALALAHGAPVGPVFDVPAATTTYRGMPGLNGPQRIRWIGDPDPLLRGVSEECDVMVSHVDEVKDIPTGFRLLAISNRCHVVAIRADRRPLYGVQFHPERVCDDPAGHRILANFVAMTCL